MFEFLANFENARIAEICVTNSIHSLYLWMRLFASGYSFRAGSYSSVYILASQAFRQICQSLGIFFLYYSQVLIL